MKNSTASRKKVSLITPAYKRAQILEQSIRGHYAALEKVCNTLGLDFELIGVEDGQLDNSSDVVKNIDLPKFKWVSYKNRGGKGFAVKYGMLQATGDYIGYVDAGIDLSPDVIEKLVTEITLNPDVHIVVGSKKHPESTLVYPLKRRLMTLGYSLVTRFFTGISYEDTQVGAKMYTKELVQKLLPRLLIKAFAFEIEMLAVAQHLGYTKHIDVPVHIDLTIDFPSSVKLKDVRNMLWDTIAVAYRLYILHYYDDRNKSNWNTTIYELTN